MTGGGKNDIIKDTAGVRPGYFGRRGHAGTYNRRGRVGDDGGADGGARRARRHALRAAGARRAQALGHGQRALQPHEHGRGRQPLPWRRPGFRPSCARNVHGSGRSRHVPRHRPHNPRGVRRAGLSALELCRLGHGHAPLRARGRGRAPCRGRPRALARAQGRRLRRHDGVRRAP